MSNSLDPDQARHSDGSKLFAKRLSADDTHWFSANSGFSFSLFKLCGFFPVDIKQDPGQLASGFILYRST